jgi:hypothetical protein
MLGYQNIKEIIKIMIEMIEYGFVDIVASTKS